jgi:hypothetical protein
MGWNLTRFHLSGRVHSLGGAQSGRRVNFEPLMMGPILEVWLPDLVTMSISESDPFLRSAYPIKKDFARSSRFQVENR